MAHPMIFTQWPAVLAESKTQTRRIITLDSCLVYGNGKAYIMRHVAKMLERDPETWRDWNEVRTATGIPKWYVGDRLSIIRKRGTPALWLDPNEQPVEDWRVDEQQYRAQETGYHHFDAAGHALLRAGYSQPKIKVTQIRVERLQDISPDDARAEGCPLEELDPVNWYRKLWNSINKRPGIRWDDNPPLVALTFKLVYIVKGEGDNPWQEVSPAHWNRRANAYGRTTATA